VSIVEDGSAPAAATGPGTTAVTNSFTPAANSLLVAVAACGGGSAVETCPVTDSLGSTWTLLKRANTNNFAGATEIWVLDAGPAPAARTVTATITGSNGLGVALTVKVLTGAQPAATCLGGFTVVPTTTAYTISITTTTTGSLACAGLVDSTASGALTGPNGATTSWQAFSDTGNGHKYGTFRATALTGVPGATVIGYTNTAANNQAIVAVEILPAGVVENPVPQPPGRLVLPWHLTLSLLAAQRQLWASAEITAATIAETGLSVAALTGDGTAKKITAQTGQTPAGVTGVGTAKKVAAQTGTVTVGASGRAVAVKRQAQTSTAIAGLAGTSTAVKKQPETGLTAAGLTGSGIQSTAASRAQTGIASIGLAGTGTAKHAVPRSGLTAVAGSGRSAQVKRATPTAVAVCSVAGHGTQKHLASRPGIAVAGLTGQAAPRHLTTLTARALVALAGHGTAIQQAAYIPAYVSVDASTGSGGLDSAATITTTDAGTSGTNLDTATSSGVVDTTTMTTGMIDA
jgi:hypothetical protein